MRKNKLKEKSSAPPAKMTLGNTLTETHAFNKNLEHCRINTNYGNVAFGSCTDPIPTGTNIQDFATAYNAGTADNGNLASWTATGWLNANRSYSYDTLNRLSTMADTATSQPCKGLSWTYDAWGNRTDQTVTSGTCNTFHQTMNTQNRLSASPYQYDAAGNMTHDASHAYTYDAENRLIAVDGGNTASYVYDALGRRVHRAGASVPYATDYFYDLSSRVVTEFDPGCSGGVECWSVGHVYLNGQQIAEYKNGTTYFHHKDHLGSTRLVTDYSGYYATDCFDFYPFGEANTPTTPCAVINPPSRSTTTHQFTGDGRDSESNLDHTLFRQYSSSLARWMHPDPAGLAAVNPSNPQSWNRYAYVFNNPVLFVDPSGLIWACTTAAGTEQCTYYPDDQFTSNRYPGGGDGGGLSYISSPCFGFAGYAHRGCPQPRPPLDVKSLQAAAKQNATKGFNACVDQAASVRNRQLLGTTGEIIAGGLVFVAVGWVTIESGGVLIHEMGADAASSAAESGFLLFSAATSDLPHVGLVATAATGGIALMAHGSAGELNALNQYDGAVGNCQVKYGFPNVPLKTSWTARQIGTHHNYYNVYIMDM
jgi:RHS repeat-associated protein